MQYFNTKMVIMLICMTIGIVTPTNAQVYSAHTLIYQATSFDDNDWHILVRYDGEKAYVATGYSSSGLRAYLIREGFERNASWADNYNKDRVFSYDAGKSTSSRTVYVRYTSDRWKEYLAVSKDKRTFRMWVEQPNGHVQEKWGGGGRGGYTYSEWIQVDPEVFKPKAINYDFLND